ncbi:MAG TPA: hypothetical protein VMR98_02840, partial [Candidatus Polarisedimenticolaceae bacterium]|nr:hypothetical protein [Candidatus Polarisedimenticolaceae bacterium]
DGELAQALQHPSMRKWKRYEVRLDRRLNPADYQKLEHGMPLTDGMSRLYVNGQGAALIVKLQEGRNRQIRRSFAVLGYQVVALHRTDFGNYSLGKLPEGEWLPVTPQETDHESTS